MPYKVEKREGDGCGADKPWAVVKEDDDSVVGCHETEDEAKEQQKALYAQEGNEEAAVTEALAPSAGAAWNATIVLSARTNDGREFDQFEWRELPLPLMWQKEQPEMGGHAKSVLVGRIEDLSIEGDKVMGRGVFDTSADAAEAQRQVGEQMLRWVSADLEPVDGVIEIVEEGDCSEEGFVAGDCQLIMRVPNARIMGATLLTFPAFPEAVIALDGTDLEQATEEGLQAAASLGLKPAGCSPCAEALIAAAIPAKPPREWFEMEEPDEPTPMELTEDGRYFGHVALYSECHIGFADQCVTAPRSNSDYSYFLTGEVECADGSKIPTGVISVGAGHADVTLSASRASAHYDDASAGVADVTAKDGKHGIWVCGALRPNVTEDQIRTLRASSPSGDWRRIRGGLEMVAVLAVNVPGFPVTRARVASGQMQTLVAAGHMPREEMQKRRQQASLERRIARLEALTMPLHVEGLRARIRPPSTQMVASSNGAG